MSQSNESTGDTNPTSTAPTHEVVSNADGIMELRFGHWHDFFSYVNLEMGRYDSIYLWRGQRDSRWEVVSSLGRHGRQDFGHLRNFLEAIAGLTSTDFDIASKDHEKAESERLKLWSLGRHFGLITPLTDWTQFPFVAVFFAFHEEDDRCDQSEFRAIYALEWDEARNLNYHIMEDGPRAMGHFRQNIEHPPYSDEFVEELMQLYGRQMRGSLPETLRTHKKLPQEVVASLVQWRHSSLEEQQLHLHCAHSNENYRVNSQGGVFVYTPNNVSVEQWVREHWKEGQGRVPALRKFLVPTRDRKDILKALNKMRINYLSLFADFEGACRYCNMALKERDAMMASVRAY